MSRIKKKISFLDLSAGLCNGSLYSDFHIKATDCHQYLEYTSSHSEHTKKSIIQSQTLRLSRICSFEQEFEGHKRNLRSWFVKRRYPEEIIDKERSKLIFLRKLIPRKRKKKASLWQLHIIPVLIALVKLIETTYIYCI